MKQAVLAVFLLGLFSGCKKSNTKLIPINDQQITFNSHHRLSSLHLVTFSNYAILGGIDFKEKGLFFLDTTFGDNGFYSFPDTVNQPEEYQIVNRDTAVFYYPDKFILSDKSGKTLFVRKLNDTLLVADSSYKYHYGSLGNFFPPYYDAAANLLYLSRYRIDIDWWFSNWYDAPVDVAYHFQGDSFQPIPVFYPKCFSRQYLGDLNTVARSIYGDENCYTFFGSPDVIFYNRKTKAIRQYELSKAGLNFNVAPYTGDPVDIQRKMDHLKRNPWFLDFYPHPQKPLGIRLLQDGVAEKNENGYTGFEDKPTVVQLFDHKMNLLEVKTIKTGLRPTCFFSGDTLKIFNGIKYVEAKTVVHYTCFLVRE